MTSAASDATYGGLDIGGTKIGVCIGNHAGEILARDEVATDPEAAPELIISSCLDRLAGLRDKLGQSPPPVALGAACPGPVSCREGRFLDPPNMPRWHGFALREFVEARLQCPVEMMNDANASVLAESYWGAAQGANTAVFLTMSTGMGAGLLLDGRVFEGPLGLAGEIGHLRLHDDGPVGFGKRGSVEGYLSGPGMVQVAEAEAMICRQIGEHSELVAALEAGDSVSVEFICRSAREGDPAARRVIERIATALGTLLAVLTDILNPEIFILGTIGMAHPDLFIARAREVLEREAIPHSAKDLRIEPSTLRQRGDQAALAVAIHAAGRR